MNDTGTNVLCFVAKKLDAFFVFLEAGFIQRLINAAIHAVAGED